MPTAHTPKSKLKKGLTFSWTFIILLVIIFFFVALVGPKVGLFGAFQASSQSPS